MYHDGELVKYESFVEDIISVLSDGSEDSYTLGIWGMFIIGKATLALNVFIKMFTSFDASCFIPNVKEEELRPGGLDHLRRELYFKLLEGESLNSSTPGFDLNLETQRLRHKKVDVEKILVITNFVLEIPSAVIDQLSSVHKPQYAIVSMLLSFIAMLLCIVELIYKCRKEKLSWKWRSTLPWLYYPSPSRKPFGSFKDIIGLVCATFQCIFATITFDFIRRHADSPIKVNCWPIVFAFGLLCSKFLEKPERRSRSIASSTSTNLLEEIV
ncbi:putative Nodulation receptor kinase [Melia azedarach]|uniref:Nodulation receptor kinase n=1 Tax=Melia azedarach TaxID=155640 RepID=A0ACC1XP57_MELAZ|nr:putative Nodulation receptor kinase [Melia azedarach]